MNTRSSLVLVCVLSTLAGCGAPLLFRDGSALPDTESEDVVSTPADPDGGSVDSQLVDDDALREDSAVAEDAQEPTHASDGAADAALAVDAQPDTATLVRSDGGLADARADVAPDVRTADVGSRDATQDTRADTGLGCRSALDCNDGLPDTVDGCEVGSGICRHERCDDGNPCTANVATAVGCTFPAVPNGTSCRPGPLMFVCMDGVCPPCGGENQVCCEWPGSTMVCQRTARCRTTAAGFRRCITCGGPGERCCTYNDGIQWASERCNTGLACSSAPGVAGLCR
jgi:hypothetical protein